MLAGGDRWSALERDTLCDTLAQVIRLKAEGIANPSKRTGVDVVAIEPSLGIELSANAVPQRIQLAPAIATIGANGTLHAFNRIFQYGEPEKTLWGAGF